MPISISYQGGDHSTESVEAVQGFAAAKQEEEEREEEVEKKKIGGKGRNNFFVTKNDASCVRCIKYSFVIGGNHLSFFY